MGGGGKAEVGYREGGVGGGKVGVGEEEGEREMEAEERLQ